MHLVRSGAAENLEQLVLELGENPIDLIRSAGLSQSQFRDPNTYIAYHKLADLMELCAIRCQIPLFGLRLAQRQSLGVLGDLPMIISRAPTVVEALSIVDKYLYLHASGVHVRLEPQGDAERLVLSLNLYNALGLNQLMQMSVAHLATFVAGLLNIDRFSMPLSLRQPAPKGADSFRQVAFQGVRFDQPFDGILLSRRQLESRNHQDEAALNEHFDLYLQQLQQRYPDSLEDQVKDTIGRLLPTGECDIGRVAAALGIHTRTLQSKLREAGTSYRSVLQDTRQTLAVQHLRYGQVSITELALQLGYSEVAVFSRHFRTWLGQSPRQWQKAQRQAQTERNG